MEGSMSATPGSVPVVSTGSKLSSLFALKVLGFVALLGVAVWFVYTYPLRYILHYNRAAFTDPNLGAANYWRERLWLVSHFVGGTLALLVGPWQFWTGFRTRYARLHRWTGRLFLAGVGIGSIGAIRLIATTTFGWAFGASMASLALAWVATAGVAYLAILEGKVEVHKRWMVRAYVVTFAFVTFRALNDHGPLSQLQPANDRAVTLGWACWAIPLLLTIAIQQIWALRASPRS
jgi:uncharacterized membrane protein YozB (DUF420 family)